MRVDFLCSRFGPLANLRILQRVKANTVTVPVVVLRLDRINLGATVLPKENQTVLGALAIDQQIESRVAARVMERLPVADIAKLCFGCCR